MMVLTKTTDKLSITILFRHFFPSRCQRRRWTQNLDIGMMGKCSNSVLHPLAPSIILKLGTSFK
jgi:hypothetical protein